MIQVSNAELSKIAQFIAGCNDMINGKFILADVKITKVLNIIAESEELYRYISECMNGFDFIKELHRAEMKNSLNGGSFTAPQQPEKLVAFVFCLLVECDAKRIDFYSFINENFISKDRSDIYAKFANTLLLPFRDIIASHFGLNDFSQEQYGALEDEYKNQINEDNPFNNYGDQNYEQTNLFGDPQVHFQPNYEEDNNEENTTIQNQQTELIGPNPSTMRNDEVWQKIPEICDNIKDCIAIQKHLNSYLKDELNYIMDTIKYSTIYRDVKITSALVTAFDEMSHKFRQIQFVFGELKNEIQNLYK